eukprot:TRINITY_DN8239_c0_g1_i2.p1 TRINITY_DN8239_c0_g1~~TRINITY_DN8239_c0_g1_i2.p1  ORF type:complete len:569 (-),score=102.52 TRINITY_DN8239_c0_g1_i2:198-1904(-)
MVRQEEAELVQWLRRALSNERTEMQVRHEELLMKLNLHIRHLMPSGTETLDLRTESNVAELTGASETEGAVIDMDIPRNLQQGSSEASYISTSRMNRLFGPKETKPAEVCHTHSASSQWKQNSRRSVLSAVLRQRYHADIPFFYRVVSSPRFELFYASLIVLSCGFMAAETQYSGLHVGYELGYKNFDMPAKDVWPGALLVFEIAEVIFGSLFALEVLLKIVGMGTDFFRHAWNWFDSMLVIAWIANLTASMLPIDGSLLRLLRLARLLRLVRLARAVQGFDSLVTMITALQGSLSALLWVAVLLLLAQMMFALLLTQVLTYFMEDEGVPIADRKEIFRYFGTFPRTMLTMFELTLGNWVPVARMLQENVSGLFIIFSILHKITFGFAVIGVVNGVFMQETMKSAHADDTIMMRTAEKLKKMHVAKMREFLAHSDYDGDGKISIQEWKNCLQNQYVHHWFAGQGLSLKDADRIFALLETDGDGKLSADELVQGVSRLQGSCKSLDMAIFVDDVRILMAQMVAHLKSLPHATPGNKMSEDGGAVEEMTAVSSYLLAHESNEWAEVRAVL